MGDIRARTRAYRDGVLEAEEFPVDAVSTYLRDPAAVVWADLCAPTERDLDAIAEELNLHALAVENAIHDRHQGPKLDRYDGHAFLTAYTVRLDLDTGVLGTGELTAFVADRALVTVRKNERVDIGGVVARWDAAPELAKAGVGFLLHGLLDHVVDGHFDAVRILDERIGALEDLVFDDRVDHTDLQRRALNLRKSLATLRRVVLLMREVVNSLLRRDIHARSTTRWSHTSRTSTTMCCASRSGPSRCAS